VRELLDGLVPGGETGKGLRGCERYLPDRLCHADLRTLRGRRGAVRSVKSSPDGVEPTRAALARAAQPIASMLQ
jgi:hypothetical protein